MRIVASGVAVKLLMDSLTDKIFGVLTIIDVDVFADLAMPGPFEEFRC